MDKNTKLDTKLARNLLLLAFLSKRSFGSTEQEVDILAVFVSNGSDVVCREHAPLPCALVAPEHPSLVDLLHV